MAGVVRSRYERLRAILGVCSAGCGRIGASRWRRCQDDGVNTGAATDLAIDWKTPDAASRWPYVHPARDQLPPLAGRSPNRPPVPQATPPAQLVRPEIGRPPILETMPDEYVNMSVVVAADGSIVEATHEQEQIADIRVQRLPSGIFDVAFITTVEPSTSRSITKATAAGGARAFVEGLHCNFSPVNRQYAHEVTVRVRIVSSPEAEPAGEGFRLDLQLAR